MNSIYNIDINKLKTLVLPTFWRRPVTEALLNAFISPMASLYASFLNFKNSIEYKQSINSQVVYLEKMLNDLYDPDERRIYILNANRQQPVWFYEEADDKPIYFYEEADDKPIYFYEEEDFTINNPDFTVYLPLAIQPLTTEQENTLQTGLRAQVDYYKLYSKNYNIIYI